MTEAKELSPEAMEALSGHAAYTPVTLAAGTMQPHTVSAAELYSWMADEKNRWRTFARSGGRGSDKELLVGGDGLFKVISHGRVLYIGGLSETAIREYNAAP